MIDFLAVNTQSRRYPIYLPTGMNPGGIQVSPYGMLLGRPVFVSQHANTFSSAGDVLLADLSYYQTITKAGGMQTAILLASEGLDDG
ncbi:hypothetical protein [Limnohabitans lacus]|uniref:Uncharacterized protein n=1 Tax=Limnohabitans lacus TaxID=3045173 RepID=A0ABT6X932_9BURK|nr:hypothetical protein [Limnohabitans sp. HM2-2]MDI9234643.1 hypothetical protein [Limnohabitans sp. HM2-2]